MSDDIKFQVIPGNKKSSDVDELIARARREWPEYIKLQQFEAERKMEQYKALIGAGFTPDEAIRLIR